MIFEGKKSRKWWEKMLNHEPKVRGDVKLQFRAINSLNNVQNRRYTTIWKMRFSEYFRWSGFFFTHYVRKKNDREKIEKTCSTMRRKDRGDLKLHFSAINSSTKSQNQQDNRLWKIRFWAYFRWSIFFLKLTMFNNKNDREKMEKTW